MCNNALVFVHLSDIHFTRTSGGEFDLDKDIRSQVEKDLATVLPKVGPATGILVTGDIAYSGNRTEYDAATDWLASLCEQLSCPPEAVWVTPGNHDVDRTVVDDSEMLKDLHKKLRAAALPSLDKKIEDTLSDPSYANAILKPTDEYVRFASRFGCAISSPDSLTWTSVFELDGSAQLKVHGLTSTLISDKHDDREGHKLVMGSFQALKAQENDVMHMTLSHHPPDWLRDGDQIEQMLNLRADIQLFGHKHVQCLQLINHDNQHETVVLASGAMHPERTEQNWTPRYNVLTIHAEVAGSRPGKELVVSIFPRVWDKDGMKFGEAENTEDDGSVTYRLPIPTGETNGAESSAEDRDTKSVAGSETAVDEEETDMSDATTDSSQVLGSARHLAYRFLTLQHHVIMRIAADLELLEDDDEGLLDHEVYKKMFERAKQSERLAALWKAVESSHGDRAEAPNPFQ